MSNIIILDWDDTLFPTYWITSQRINITNENIRNKYTMHFSQLDIILHKLLSKMLEKSKVIIVTNAGIKWINISANCVSNTKKLMHDKIPVISARDKFNKQYPNDAYAWKKITFVNVANNYKNYKIKTILSIGDADYELKALLNLSKNKSVPNTYYKSIKLITSPSFDLLLQQLNALFDATSKVINQSKNMDLAFIKV